jgi:hypothetical protein
MEKSQFLLFCLLVECAGYILPPLPVDHPAHPDAAAAPEQPASRTLAYIASDLPSRRPATPEAVAQEEDHQSHHDPQAGNARTVSGEGKVVATVPNANQVVIEHGPIKGFMDAAGFS